MSEGELSNSDRQAIFMDVVDRMSTATQPCIAAIYGVVSGSEGELAGSGTFVEVEGRVFVLTASHVVREDSQKYSGYAYHYLRDDVPSLVEGEILRDDDLDLALIPVHDPVQNGTTGVRPISLGTFDQTAQNLDGDILFIHGYPGDRSKFLALFEGVVAESQPYGTVVGTSVLDRFDERLHLAIDYGLDAIDVQGQATEVSQPAGLSGAAIWRTSRSGNPQWEPALARIVGVAHRWDRTAGSLVGTRVEEVRAFIARVAG